MPAPPRKLLADAIEAEAKMLIIGDYDCDGATATRRRHARAARARRRCRLSAARPLQARLRPVAGNRRSRREQSPDLIITVDNGIASVEGVAAPELGIATLITDHHLPGDNAARRRLHRQPQPARLRLPVQVHRRRRRHVLRHARPARRTARARLVCRPPNEPNLASLLDLVALGTVADVVKLDRNNRILVSQGLKRMRAGRCNAGLAALFKAAGRDPKKASAIDLGFMIGPRLNAAGRLADMRLGIECLLTDDPAAP
jgi:single-stranded-DNA-specific exonuclease